MATGLHVEKGAGIVSGTAGGGRFTRAAVIHRGAPSAQDGHGLSKSALTRQAGRCVHVDIEEGFQNMFLDVHEEVASPEGRVMSCAR
ncbi:MAG TPA: hypothetical protein VIL72_11175 [Beijerinckiaceae bacterium]